MFAVVYSAGLGGARGARPRGRDQLRDDGPRLAGVRLGRAGLRRGRDHDRDDGEGHLRARGDGLLRVRVGVAQPGRARKWCAAPGPTSCGGCERERRAQGDAGQVPPAPLRGRIRGLQPDPHRRRVREAGGPAREHPPRPLHDGPGRARERERRGRRPARLRRLSVQFRGMGFPEQEITVTGPSRRSAAGGRGRDRGRAGRQPDHPERRSRAAKRARATAGGRLPQ